MTPVQVGMRENRRPASAGKVRPTIERRRLEDVNEVLQGLREGHIQGRVVLDIGSA